MGNICKEIGYTIFLLLSFLSYITEIVINCVLAYYLFVNDEIVWFALLLCLITVPSISLQLVSYQQQLTLKPDRKRTLFWEAAVVIIHIFQFALPWRYIRLILSHRIPVTSNEIWQIFLLRALHTYFSGIPIIFLQVYKILTSMDTFSASQNWYLIVATTTSIMSIAWALATYQKYQDYCCVISLVPPWTATLIKIIWRVGEIFSRVLTLGLFALVHKFWVFLVIGFHWLTMLLVLIVDHVLQSSDKEKTLGTFAQLLLKSYLYIFSHLNLTSKKSKYGFIFFYIICSLESIALLTLWMIYEKRTQYHIPFGVAVAGGYALALIFALVYYNCFHRGSSKEEHKHVAQTTCLHQCADCRLNHYPKLAAEGDAQGTKPWLHVSQNPDPRFFDILQASDCNSDRSSDMPDNNSLQRNQIIILDARKLSEQSNHSNHIKGGKTNAGMEWDDYDLQIRETPEGASLQDSQIKESPRSSTHSKKGYHSRQGSSIEDKEVIETLDSPRGHADQGYFSGISASSKEHKSLQKNSVDQQKQILPHKLIAQKELQKNQKQQQKSMSINSASGASDQELLNKVKYQKQYGSHQHHHHQHHPHHPGHKRQHSASGIQSDSTFSGASSTRPILNCERCGHHVSIDSMSLYSMTSTSATSMGSSMVYNQRKQPLPQLNHHQRGSSVDRDRPFKRQQPAKRNKSGAQGVISKKCSHHNTELQLPMNAAQRNLYGYSNSPRHVSDATSSGWDCTDSEI